MPRPQEKETEEPSGSTKDGRQADLNSLLHEVSASNNGNLNLLHARGRVLFAEGEPTRGVYILRNGRAAVSISSSEGRVVILRMAHAGDVLGLNSVLRNGFYDVTVKTLEPCHTAFISRTELIEVMGKSRAGAQAVLSILSRELAELTERARSLLLPQTASARIARLLLEWCTQSTQIDKFLTQEEIAQMICSSRETVTRLLTSMSRGNIIRITSDSIVIRDYAALERMALS